MKRLILLSLLTRVVAAQNTGTQHPFDVQVVASHLTHECEGGPNTTFCRPVMHIIAVINGHHYELESERLMPLLNREVLIPGSYKASLVKEKHSKPYREYLVYELEYPDGETERFFLVGETT